MGESDKKGIRRVEKWLPLFVVAIGIVAYSSSFSGPFIFDDYPSIVKNQELRSILPVPMTSRWVTNLSFRLNYAVSHLNVADYHAVNLAIHILAALLLFGVVRRTLQLPRLCQKYGEYAPWLAAWVAGIWVAHPLNTESVAYVCQRYEAMMGLFFLGIVYAFTRAVSGSRPRLWFDLAILLLVIGTGTKIVIFVAPAVLLAYDYLFVASSTVNITARRWRVHLALWLALLVGGVLWFNGWVRPAGQLTTNVSEASPFQYLLTQSRVILHYLRLSFVPFPLCFDYGWSVVESWHEVIVEGLLVLGLLALTIFGLVKRKPAAFLGVCWFAILAPTSSVVPVVDVIVEHRLYLPVAAVWAGVVLGFHELLVKVRPRWRVMTEATVFSAVLACFISLTISRIGVYQTEEAMWMDIVNKAPDNPRGRLGLAVALAGKGDKKAMDELQKVFDLLPDNIEKATQKERTLLMQAYANKGFILYGRGDYTAAEGCFRDALAIHPAYLLARNNLGLCLRWQGKDAEAIDQWEKSLAQDPTDVAARNCLGSLYMARGELGKAVSCFEESLRYQPDMRSVVLDLAWILSTANDDGVRDGDRAIEILTPLVKASGSNSISALDVMGMAQAAAGRFDSAIEWAQKAVEIARASGVDAAEIEKRIHLYKNQKAYTVQKRSSPADAELLPSNTHN